MVRTGRSNICLCDFYFEGVNVCGLLHLILLLLVLLLLRFHVTLPQVAVLLLALGICLFKFPTWLFVADGFLLLAYFIFTFIIFCMVSWQQYYWPSCGLFLTCNICGFSQLTVLLMVNLVLHLQFYFELAM